MATLTFLMIVGALLAAFAYLVRRLRLPPLLSLGAWLALAGGCLSVHAWQTYEFKAALYLLLALGMVCVVTIFADSLARREPTVRSNLAWVLLSVLTVHTAEIGMVAVILLGAVLVWHRKLAPIAFGAAVFWPLGFWGLNRLLFPRDTVVLQNATTSPPSSSTSWGRFKTWKPEAPMAAGWPSW